MVALSVVAAQAGEDRLGEVQPLGGLASLAPLCDLRDGDWAADLRRALVQALTQAPRTDDPGLQAAPGRAQAEAELGFADAEALEDFAQQPDESRCASVAADPALPRADAMVAAFRQRAARERAGF